jgi:hypothetical protein
MEPLTKWWFGKSAAGEKNTPQTERKFPTEDILTAPIYNSLNWNKSVVAGSYALQQFTGDQWNPNDIDIVVNCKDKNEFKEEVNNFIGELHERTLIAKVIKFNLDPHADPLSSDRQNRRDERFHESIVATCTLDVQTVPKPVQLVGINPVNRTLLAHLRDITDVPACVNYTVEDGRRIFHVGEKCAEALFTRKMSGLAICESRKQKYKERGYDTM